MIVRTLDLPCDLGTLFGAAAKEPGAAFLDSGMRDYGLGRWAYLACWPEAELALPADPPPRDPLGALRAFAGPFKGDLPAGPLPFMGGCVGYLSYDLGRCFERLPARLPPLEGARALRFFRYPGVLGVDCRERRLWLASWRDDAEAGAYLDRLEGLARRAFREPVRRGEAEPFRVGEARPNFEAAGFRDAVRRARQWIASGDVYQINVAQRFEAAFSGSKSGLYSALRACNPAPYAAYLDFGDEAVLSSSPERFLRLRGRVANTRPIKGTRPRTGEPAADAREREALLRSEKERAELLMIVDLERNDLGRVAEAGSVTVEGLHAIEAYPTVFHQTASVSARLASGVDAVDCLRAMFPGGSITGAPKIRAMELIEAIEPCRRGVYTGSVGWLGLNGDAEFNIAIRTFHLSGGRARFHAGSGIVWDSDPQAEYEETLHKALGLFRALERGATGKSM